MVAAIVVPLAEAAMLVQKAGGPLVCQFCPMLLERFPARIA